MFLPRGHQALKRRFSSLLSPIQAQQIHNRTEVCEENLERYCSGGYHPVHIGDEFDSSRYKGEEIDSGRYKIVGKLGYGAFSTVWLAQNLKPSHRVKNRHVALKFLTADTSFEMGNTTLERSILKKLNKESNNSPGVNRITKLLHDFTFSGPNGKHSCLVFKPTGPSLSEYRKLFPGLRVPVPIVKNIARQLLQGLAYLHDTCNVVHTGKRLHTLEGIRLLTLADIKLQNILIDTPEMDKIFDRTPTELFLRESHPVNPPDNFYMQSTSFVPEEILKNSADISIKLADFGSACYTFQHLTEWIQPDVFRAPEVILGDEWKQKVDIWNFGLVIWELVQGKLCFDGQVNATTPYSSEAHLAQMQAILGPFPDSLIKSSTSSDKYFDSQGRLMSDIHIRPVSLSSMNAHSGAVEGEEASNFVDFIHRTLALQPRQRPSAYELLQSRWLRSPLERRSSYRRGISKWR